MSGQPLCVVVGVSGASGSVYALELLRQLRAVPQVQTHVVVSDAAWLTLRHECDADKATVAALADVMYDVRDMGAAIASGSFQAHGMVVAPCSMRTLACIANGLGDNLLTRAADVMLKERRRLVLLAREAPLHAGHLRNMLAVTELGAVVFPPVPAFYLQPQTLHDMVAHSVTRVLDLMALPVPVPTQVPRWTGLSAQAV